MNYSNLNNRKRRNRTITTASAGTKAVALLVASPVLIVVALLGCILNGWALHLRWNWFIPQAFGLPDLTIAQSVGVSLVVGLLVNKPEPDGHESTLGAVLAFPFIYVFMGWIVQAIFF